MKGSFYNNMGKIRVFFVGIQFFWVSGVTFYGSFRYLWRSRVELFTMYSVFCVFGVWSFWQSVRTCPGFVEKYGENELGEEDAKAGKGFCELCKCVKEAGVSHCSSCSRCVINRSHHCHWINNCVGKYNHKFFVLYLFYSCVWSLFSVGVNGAVLGGMFMEKWDDRQVGLFCLSVISVVVGLVVFGICSMVLYDQIQILKIKKTNFQFSDLKNTEPRTENFCHQLKKIFGNGPKSLWIFPILPNTQIIVQEPPNQSSKYIINKTSLTHQTL